MMPPRENEAISENLGKPLDPNATIDLQTIIEDFRELLLYHANQKSEGDRITAQNLRDVSEQMKGLNRELRDGLRASADAQAVISVALKENKFVEWISYIMALILFAFGLFLLWKGATDSDVSTRIGTLISGSIIELLILIPFRFAINSRRHNIALRMLGIILDRVTDPKKVAPLLKDTFMGVVLGQAQFKVGR